MPKKTNDRWTPVRKGNTYCSPGCGAGCTIQQFNRATKAAAKLAARMGKGWKPDVWENLGWFYRVVSADGRVEIHPPQRRGDTYWVAVESDADTGQYTADGATPEKALKLVTERIQRHARMLAALVRRLPVA